MNRATKPNTYIPPSTTVRLDIPLFPWKINNTVPMNMVRLATIRANLRG